MGSFSVWHWLIVLLIILLVFGTKKLRTATTTEKKAEAPTIDVQAKDKTPQ